MNLFKSSVLCGMVIVSFMTSCTDVDITMPKGPKGDTGLSAYEFWKEKVADGTVNWPKDQTEVADFFKFLKGKDGKDGKDGPVSYTHLPVIHSARHPAVRLSGCSAV